ncbi:uncharacterized protein LTR77_002173 [Saxophila tyrrhenica]|uniref:Uncharacterized protein n=1 Tax=Saxophila tyrrhenica TaxID=1690608 RepID=A0AAV9PI69_9PEZI|nr:hypothetical protein LTR77_002173 [Saxophila tyrrhenica]
MASSTNFGASIVPPTKEAHTDLTIPPAFDSPALTPAASREDLADASTDHQRVPIHSPFYTHPPASFERIHSRNNSTATPVANEKDVEAGLATPLTNHPFRSKVSIDCSKECKMWPSKQTLVASKNAEKKRRRENQTCGHLVGPVQDWWGLKTKRQRLIMKIMLALFVLGVVVAIAVGITIAVNGSVYVSDNHSEKIPEPDASK